MTIEELKKTAAMAHLNMDGKELAGILPAFEQVLALLEPMQAAASDKEAFPGGLPESALGGAFGNFRAAGSAFSSPAGSAAVPRDGLNEALLNNAGERDGRFLVVPNVL